IASAKIIRPSASVEIISTVVPSRLPTTSPGREAPPSGIFSTRGIIAMIFWLILSLEIALIASITAAAPAMSVFISHILEDGGFLSQQPTNIPFPLLLDQGLYI